MTEEQEEMSILQAIRGLDVKIEDAVAEPEKEKPVEKKKTTAAEKKKLDEALAIYDALLTQKHYEEVFKIGRKIAGVWRSRTSGQSNTIYKLVDASNFSSGMAINNYLNLLNMSYSLIAFNGENLANKPVAERLKFLEGLPEAIVVALSQSLIDFDVKIREAVEVGRENF